MTEKQYAPTKTEKKMTQKAGAPKQKITESAKKTEEKKETEKTADIKLESKEKQEIKTEDKKTKQSVKKIKKEEVAVNAKSVPVSTKYAIAICKSIKKKRIGDAIRDLELVIQKKKSVPMKGEYAHKKGMGKIASGSGKYPVAASKHFIVLLKSLAGNANNHEIDEPIISEAVANMASRPFGRFGRVRRKRTHITIKAKEMKIKEEEK